MSHTKTIESNQTLESYILSLIKQNQRGETQLFVFNLDTQPTFEWGTPAINHLNTLCIEITLVQALTIIQHTCKNLLQKHPHIYLYYQLDDHIVAFENFETIQNDHTLEPFFETGIHPQLKIGWDI